MTISLRNFGTLLPAVLVLAAGLLAGTGLGPYLDDALFFHPWLMQRPKLGLAPPFDPRLHLVLVDDKSLDRMQRHPTFGDWQTIAKLLFAEGFEQVFLPAIPQLPSEIGEIGPRHEQGSLVLGVVVHQERDNPRGMDARSLPSSLLLENAAGVGAALYEAPSVLAPAPEILAVIDGVASFNILRNDALPFGYAVGKDRFLPSMGIMAGGTLASRGDRLTLGNVALPLPRNRQLYIDFLPEQAIMAHALNVNAFFGPDGEVRAELPKNVRERLVGGKVALLVPDAFSGGRFLDSPVGKVPAYHALASLMSDAMRGHFLHEPMPRAWLVWLAVPLLWLLLRLKDARLAGGLTLGVTALGAPLAIAAIQWEGWILPYAQLAIVALVGAATRQAHEMLAALKDKLKLRHELAMGQTVQSLLLPHATEGRLGPWEYGLIFRPHGAMSGDWFQVYRAAENTQGVVGLVAIGDVVGKGPSAALNTATIAGLWHHHAASWAAAAVELESFCRSLAGTLYRTYRGQQNTTLSMAALGPAEITLACAGAPSWLRCAPGQKPETLAVKRLDPFGTVETLARVPVKTVPARPGDLFVAFTDGVVDGSSARGKFLQLLAEVPRWPAEIPAVLATLERVANAAAGRRELPDDFTLVVLRYRGAASLPAENIA